MTTDALEQLKAASVNCCASQVDWVQLYDQVPAERIEPELLVLDLSPWLSSQRDAQFLAYCGNRFAQSQLGIPGWLGQYLSDFFNICSTAEYLHLLISIKALTSDTPADPYEPLEDYLEKAGPKLQQLSVTDWDWIGGGVISFRLQSRFVQPDLL